MLPLNRSVAIDQLTIHKPSRIIEYMELRALPEIDYASHPYYHGFGKKDDLAEKAAALFAPLLGHKRASLQATAAAFLSRPRDADDEILGTLARDGVAGITLPSPLMHRLRQAATAQAAVLEVRMNALAAEGARIRFDDTLSPIIEGDQVRAGSEDLAEAVAAVIAEIGFSTILQSYYPDVTSAVTTHAVLKRNIANHDMFRAKGRPTTRTGGLHVDSHSRPTMNGIIYLNEVGPDQGPLSYVIGSHHWQFDLEDRAIRKAIDETGFGSKGGAELFVTLSPEYQRKADFGWDVVDESPESSALLSAERAFCSEKCDVVLFDADGVHRGGNAREGHRLSILFKQTYKKE